MVIFPQICDKLPEGNYGHPYNYGFPFTPQAFRRDIGGIGSPARWAAAAPGSALQTLEKKVVDHGRSKQNID